MTRFPAGNAGWAVSAHPRGRHRVLDAPPSRVGPGHGLLRLRLGKTGVGGPRRYDAPDRWIYPGTPVVLVDGVPTVQGFGTAWLRLPVGDYHIEVQAGGSRGWWLASVADGATTGLDFVNAADSAPAVGRKWRFGPPGLRGGRYANALWWILPAVIAANLALLAVPRGSAVAAVAWIGVFALAFGLLGGRHLARVRASRRLMDAQPESSLEADPPLPAPGRLARMYRPVRDEIPAGLGMLVLDLRWEPVWQRLASPEGTGLPQMREYGEPLPSDARPWIDPPTLVVGPHVVEAHWARLCLPLRPGGQEVEIALPRLHTGAGAASEDFVVHRTAVAIEAGAHTHLDLTAAVVQHHDGRDYALEVVGIDEEAARRTPPAYPRRQPPLRPMDGEDRSHRPYSIALPAAQLRENTTETD